MPIRLDIGLSESYLGKSATPAGQRVTAQVAAEYQQRLAQAQMHGHGHANGLPPQMHRPSPTPQPQMQQMQMQHPHAHTSPSPRRSDSGMQQ